MTSPAELPTPLLRLLEFHPVLATEKGVHDFDHRLTSYAPAVVEGYIAACRADLERVEGLLARPLPPGHWTDLVALRGNLRMELFWLVDVRWHEINPLVYVDDALNGLHVLLLQEHRPRAKRLAALASRLTQIPRLLREARHHLRTPRRLFTELAIEGAADGETFLAELSHSHHELAPGVREARRALDAFARFLTRLLPDAEDRAELGTEAYSRLLETDFMLEADLNGLRQVGERVLARLAPVVAKRRATRPGRPGPAPDGFGREEVLQYYRWEIDQVREFVRERDLVAIPHAPITIVESPEYLDALLPRVCYQAPPPYVTDRTGYLFLSPIPHPLDGSARDEYWLEKSHRGFRKDVVHELYPGHHLQMVTAANHGSAIRRFQSNDLFVEGWALYCEELLEEQGLYGGVTGESAFAIFFRAARVVIDVNLQTGAWDVERAIRFFGETLGPEHAGWYRREVHRYLTEPGQAMSYLIGKLAVERMRDRARAEQGKGFSLRAFHDRLLAEGSVQPALVEASMFGEAGGKRGLPFTRVKPLVELAGGPSASRRARKA